MPKTIFMKEDYDKYLKKLENHASTEIDIRDIIDSFIEEELDRFGIYAMLLMAKLNNTTEKDDKTIRTIVEKDMATLIEALRLDVTMVLGIIPTLDDYVLKQMCQNGLMLMLDDEHYEKNREYVLYVIYNLPYAEEFVLKRYNKLLKDFMTEPSPLTSEDVLDFVAQDYQLV